MLSDESTGRQRHHSNWKYQDNLTHAEVFRKGVKSKLKIFRLCSSVPRDSEAPSDQLFVLPELTNIPVGMEADAQPLLLTLFYYHCLPDLLILPNLSWH